LNLQDDQHPGQVGKWGKRRIIKGIAAPAADYRFIEVISGCHGQGGEGKSGREKEMWGILNSFSFPDRDSEGFFNHKLSSEILTRFTIKCVYV
jgi:hypothetical protein